MVETVAKASPEETSDDARYALDVFGIGAAGLGGNVQAAGGGAAVETFLTPRFAVRVGGAVRAGDLEGVAARTTTLLGSVGVELHAWPTTPSRVLGASLRADYVLMNQSVTHYSASGDLSTMARSLSGVDAVIEVEGRLGPKVDILVGAGIEEMLATTYVDMNGARVGTLPPLSAIAQGGLRLRF